MAFRKFDGTESDETPIVIPGLGKTKNYIHPKNFLSMSANTKITLLIAVVTIVTVIFGYSVVLHPF